MQPKDIIRRLVGELSALAREERNREKIEGWTRLNDRQPQRPML